MQLFVVYVLIIIASLWMLYYLLFHTSATGFNLLGRVRELELGLINQVSQALGRILAVLGYPLGEIEMIQNRIVNEGVNFAQNLIRQIARQSFFIACGISGMLLILLIGVIFHSNLIMIIILIAAVVWSFLTMVIYDPIIGSIAQGKKIRRSIRPISLLLAYIGILTLLWLNFNGTSFFNEVLGIFVILSLVLMIFSFRSYYLMRITNTAGYALGTILTVLLILFIFKSSSPSLYGNLVDTRTEFEQTNKVKYVTQQTPLYAIIITNEDTTIVKVNSQEGIPTIKKGEQVVRGDNTVVYKQEVFGDIWLADDNGLYVLGPFWIPLRWLSNNDLNPKNILTDNQNQSVQPPIDTPTDPNTFTLPPHTRVKVMDIPAGRENIVFRSTGKYRIIERDGPKLVLSKVFKYNTNVAGGTLEIENINDFPIEFKVEL